VATHLANEGPRLWYGTPDAPAPDGVEEGRSGVSVVIGVKPARPGNAVSVRYRVDGGQVQRRRARLTRTDFERGIQYFRADFPPFWSGKLVEYLPMLTVAGRPVGDPALASTFPSSFRLGARPVEVVSTRPANGRISVSAPQPTARFPFTMDYLATAAVPLRTSPEVIGPTPEGFKLNWYPVPGGVFVGPAFRATVGIEGEHNMVFRPDGVGVISVRVTVETDDGALLSVSYSGLLELGEPAFRQVLSGDFAHLPASISVRTAPRVLTTHPKYLWLNHLQYVGVGELRLVELIYTYDLYAVR
jgi:hypothetical protein